jgi:hypothetical protein
MWVARETQKHSIEEELGPQAGGVKKIMLPTLCFYQDVTMYLKQQRQALAPEANSYLLAFMVSQQNVFYIGKFAIWGGSSEKPEFPASFENVDDVAN